jgi:hypothetical protein
MPHATVLQDTREALYPLQAPKLHQDSLPTFIYSYKWNSDQLHRTCLVLENAQAIECLHTPSSMAAVGVKYLEQAYSSLVEAIL